MYTFSQSSGDLRQDGRFLFTGWSGHDEGRNNPAMQADANLGPLPRGKYKISKAYTHPKLGQVVMNLTPDPANEMFGRSAFRIHGASKLDPAESSHGCIILPRVTRIRIDMDSDKDLEVIG